MKDDAHLPACNASTHLEDLGHIPQVECVVALRRCGQQLALRPGVNLCGWRGGALGACDNNWCVHHQREHTHRLGEPE